MTLEEITGKYFVKHEKVHKYPVPSNCNAKRESEKLHTTIPAGTEKCDHCFELYGTKGG